MISEYPDITVPIMIPFKLITKVRYSYIKNIVTVDSV